MASQTIRINFVCLGNICRSPTAEGVMKKLVEDAGLRERFFIDSSGTGAYHSGERADPRSRASALGRGIELTSISRQFVARDFEDFDYVVAMDRSNLSDLQRLANSASHQDKLHLLCAFDAGAGSDQDVPDPYYGSGDGFGRVLDICEAGCRGLLKHLVSKHGL